LAISPNNTNATVVLDGSKSFDPDDDPLTYQWLSPPNPRGPVLLATGVVAVITLPVGAHGIQLVVNDGMARATDSFSVEVITLDQAVGKLLQAIHEGEAGSGQSLIASLRAALASIDRSHPIAAINQLQAFQRKVLAQVAPDDPELAAEFVQLAQEIIDSLAQGELGSRNLRALANQEADTVQVEFEGTAGTIYIIEASSDMVHWEKIGVGKHRGKGRFQFEDPDANRFPSRFYRVIRP
jgi:hypothetical protein